MSLPLCLVVSDSDSLFRAVEAAGLRPFRAVDLRFHEPALLCPFAAIDLTNASPAVWWALGIRHGARPHRTVAMAPEGTQLPFDITPIPVAAHEGELTALLKQARLQRADNPLLELLDGPAPMYVEHLKTDRYRELGAGGPVDLLLAHRDQKAWNEAVELAESMPEYLRGTAMVREQYAMALNRVGRREDAKAVLNEILEERGPSSETYAILGRVHKDEWDLTHEPISLALAIAAYRSGFEADWRDAFPGVNVVTLIRLRDPSDSEADRLIPLVRYAVERKIARGSVDYWDYATLIELSVHDNDPAATREALAHALATKPMSWMKESTARNLRLLREKREELAWVAKIEAALLQQRV